MKKYIIVGNSSYSYMIKKYIDESNGGEICAYCADKEYINVDNIEGVPVISFEELRNHYSVDEVRLIMGIGYTQMGNLRKRIFEQCVEWGYKFENYIHPTAIIPQDLNIGTGNNILEGVIIEVGVTIGDANLFFGGSMLGHETVVGSYNTFAGKSMTAGCVCVKNCCFLGVSSAVKDHVTLNDYVMLGAMAYGYKDMDEYTVVVPAKSVVLKDKKSTDYL